MVFQCGRFFEDYRWRGIRSLIRFLDICLFLNGLAAAVISILVANWRAGRSKKDDTLGVFACHGVGGIWGSIVTGLFASAAVNGVNGLLFGKPDQMISQVLAVVVVGVFAFFGSYLWLGLVNVFSPLWGSPQAEDAGLDLSEQGEEAYQLD